MFDFIDKNLEKIKDPSKILCVRPYKKKGLMALYAIVCKQIGEYELLQLTEGQSLMDFPAEPLFHFYVEKEGKFLLNNFINFSNYYAFNKKLFAGFGFASYLDRPSSCILYAKFKDGSASYMSTHKKERFIKKDMVRLKALSIEHGLEFEDDFKTSTPQLIEDYMENNVACIPYLEDEMQ